MVKQSPEEIRKEVLEEDDKKDVSIYLAVPVAVLAGVAGVSGLCAVIMMRALMYFRQGIDAYWLTCVPFLFPIITGLFAAYKKQFGLLGVHLVVCMLALLMGGFGFGMSVEPIFINRDDCQPASPGIECNKITVSYLYFIGGAAAAGFTALGILVTLCGLYSASQRISERERQAEVRHMQEVEEHQKELRRMKAHDERRPRTLSAASHTHPPSSPTQTSAPNGIAQAQAPPQAQINPETCPLISTSEGMATPEKIV